MGEGGSKSFLGGSDESSEKYVSIASVARAERKRVDSDVRYFLRQPSTPWIVFNRDSKAAASEKADAAFESIANEPSNVVVAADIVPRPASKTIADVASIASITSPTPLSVSITNLDELVALDASSKKPSRVKMILGAGATMIALAGAAIFGARGQHVETRASKTVVVRENEKPQPAIDPDLAVSQVSASIANVVAPKKSVAVAKGASGASSGSGWLGIRGAAASQRVYLDGKLLLGQGARSFPVKCGDHTIALNDKHATRDVEVPCAGELTVTK